MSQNAKLPKSYFDREKAELDMFKVLCWLKKAHEENKSVDRRKLTDAMMFEFNVSSAKAKIYLSLLSGAGRIDLDHDIVRLSQKEINNINAQISKANKMLEDLKEQEQ